MSAKSAAGIKSVHPELQGILQQLPYGILLAAGVLYLSLPQAILLWSEPDMDSDAHSREGVE